MINHVSLLFLVINQLDNLIDYMSERIKKASDGNKYYLTPQGMWVRDFTTEQVPYIDLNQTIENKDYFTFLQNETKNSLDKYTWIDSENFHIRDVVIVSDGVVAVVVRVRSRCCRCGCVLWFVDVAGAAPVSDGGVLCGLRCR